MSNSKEKLFTEFTAPTTQEWLDKIEVDFSRESACCVIVASEGYPVSYKKGYEIKVGDLDPDARIFYAGASIKDGKTATSGGRVLGVTCTATDLKTAIDRAYSQVEKVSFENAYYRKDIGKRALAAN